MYLISSGFPVLFDKTASANALKVSGLPVPTLYTPEN